MMLMFPCNCTGGKPTPAKFYDPLSEFGPHLIVVHQHLETAFQITSDFPGIPVVLHRHGRFERNSAYKRWKYTRKMNRLAGIVWVAKMPAITSAKTSLA